MGLERGEHSFPQLVPDEHYVHILKEENEGCSVH